MARKHTEMELLQFIGLHLEGVPYRTLVEKFNLMLSIAVFMKYVDKYQRHGVEGIRYQKNNRRYTKEFKQQIVSEHLRTG